jgi:hypothetical protein
MKNNAIMVGIAALVIGAAAGFYGGTQYQKSQKVANFGQPGSGQFVLRNSEDGGTLKGNTVRGGFKPVAGEIIASDEKSITVKLQDGSSKIVILSDKTAINKAEEADKSELKTGQTVSVFGVENKDGSVTAQNIQLGTTFRMMEAK